MRDHTKLESFHLADQLLIEVYRCTKRFPEDERFGLASQLRRAAVSVGANIVEASARPTEGDYIRFLSIAYASAKELQYELSIASRLGYVQSPVSEELDLLATRTAKTLWALVNRLQEHHRVAQKY